MKGQPQGLIAAALANMGERFGFYIMMAILTLFISAKFGLDEATAGYIYSGFYASIYLLALVGGIIADKTKPMEERFAATLKLAEMPRNSSATRIRNRCELTGRPRSNYRKNKLSRIALRELGSKGLVPGLVKSSW